jgi:hypothetical protein
MGWKSRSPRFPWLLLFLHFACLLTCPCWSELIGTFKPLIRQEIGFYAHL